MNDRSLLQPAFLLVLGVDQLLKGAAVLLLPPGAGVRLLPGLDYVLLQSVGGIASPERLRLAVIVLLSAWLLLRLRRRAGFAELYPQPPLALLAGGLAGNLVDLLLLRERIGLFRLRFPQGDVLLSVADVAIAAGALLMVLDLARAPRPALPALAGAGRPAPLRVELGALPRGIDNVRVDVHLSPTLRRLVREIAAAVLTPHIWREAWRATTPFGADSRSLERLRAAYRELLETVAHRAGSEDRPVLVALAQLAVVACIRDETAAVFERLVQDFQREADAHPRAAARTAARHRQHLAAVRGRRGELIEQTRELLLQQVQRTETAALRELYAALAGEGAGLPGDLLANPMLCAPDPDDEGFLLRRYLLLGQRADDPAHPRRVESLLREFFGCAEDGFGDGPARETCPWLEEPDRLRRLLDVEGTEQERQRVRRHDPRRAAELARRVRAQRRTLAALERRLRGAGLLPTVLAGESVEAVWAGLSLPISPRLLQRYLVHPGERRALGEKLRRIERGTSGQAPIVASLERARRRIARLSRGERRRVIARFAHGFAVYLRDCKRLRDTRRWLEQIRLLSAPEPLRLARVNRTLHELLIGADRAEPEAVTVTGHAIVKADVRGSTAMTAELLQRRLNPATHFATHFFEPIAGLIGLYGARKVFVEGDAIILALLEKDGEGGAHLAVARACGLARSILEVVRAHNVAAAADGLPVLELGIGIAYEPGPPTWLYDDDHPIMISPAIGRADRLSSCAAFLREQPHYAAGHRVQVFQATASSPAYDKKGAARFRYNVDGIELEPAAFARLQRELPLERHPAGCGTVEEWLHTGRYPDARGVLRDLAVREGRVWTFDRRKGPMVQTQEAFFEVVERARGGDH